MRIRLWLFSETSSLPKLMMLKKNTVEEEETGLISKPTGRDISCWRRYTFLALGSHHVDLLANHIHSPFSSEPGFLPSASWAFVPVFVLFTQTRKVPNDFIIWLQFNYPSRQREKKRLLTKIVWSLLDSLMFLDSLSFWHVGGTLEKRLSQFQVFWVVATVEKGGFLKNQIQKRKITRDLKMSSERGKNGGNRRWCLKIRDKIKIKKFSD